jgi:hypothetical protein
MDSSEELVANATRFSAVVTVLGMLAAAGIAA